MQTQPQNVAYPGLFKGTFYVDPTFTGLQAGSQSNPFTTIAAAFAAALAVSLTGALVILPPNVTITENVIFPDGGNWEIASQTTTSAAGAGNGTRINGTVTINNTSVNGTNARLTDIRVLGATSGNTTAGAASLYLVNARIEALTLTGAGAAFWQVICTGYGTNVAQLGGTINGVCAIFGSLFSNTFSHVGALTVTAVSYLVNCRVPASITIDGTTGSVLFTLEGCNFAAPTTITGISTASVQMDGLSLAQAITVGLILAGTATMKTFVANASHHPTATDNIASTAFGARQPVGLYEMTVDATLLVAGGAGSVGLLQVNAIYTNMVGTLTTKPALTVPLDITGVVGSETSAIIAFRHNGAAAPIAYSITGIVTPGAMSVAVAIAIRRAD